MRCGAPRNNRHTTSQSANLFSRASLRNGIWRKNPNNSGCASQKIRPCDARRWTALRRLYRANNETEKLYDVLQRLHESSPNEAPITADLARLGLNLERNVERSHELAKEAHDRAPNEVNCAVTYAFSLYRLGRNTEAIAIIQGLPADQLHDPHAAVYAAFLLADTGQIDAAKDYVAAADDEIYPEEKKVLDEAKAKIVRVSELRRQQFHQFLLNRVQYQRLRHVESVNSDPL